ncbi:MAG: aldo/keto reductase [Alphaproteobacteria bacterium]|nr:aldo/keto reductase [Alphaproteobacteria bacterium]
MTMTSTFPRLGTTVSRLGFGGAAIGLTNYLGDYAAGSPAARAAAVDAIRAARAGGLTYFDTAPGYGKGLSEEILGEALAGERDIIVATKVPQASLAEVRRSAEASLARLKRTRLDLLQIHGTSLTLEAMTAIRAPGGTLDQLVRLREEGLVAAIGFTSEDNNGAVYELISSGAFDTMQIAYNLLLQHPCEPTRPFGSLFEAKKRGLFTIAMRGLTSGIFQRWIRLANPADRFDYSAALIQFVLSNPLIDVALVGMRTPEEVRANLAIWGDEAGRIDIEALWSRYPTPVS